MQSAKQPAVRAARPKVGAMYQPQVRQAMVRLLAEVSSKINAGLSPEQVIVELEKLMYCARTAGRIDEITRIEMVTLDAAVDVWSTDDDANIMLIGKRRAQLESRMDTM